MYSLILKPKIEKKDKEQLRRVLKKIERILKAPYFFKQLKGELHGARRVHVKPYVLVYEIDEKNKAVRIIEYEHHDAIY